MGGQEQAGLGIVNVSYHSVTCTFCSVEFPCNIFGIFNALALNLILSMTFNWLYSCDSFMQSEERHQNVARIPTESLHPYYHEAGCQIEIW